MAEFPNKPEWVPIWKRRRTDRFEDNAMRKTTHRVTKEDGSVEEVEVLFDDTEDLDLYRPGGPFFDRHPKPEDRLGG